MRGISSAFGLVLILSRGILQAGVEPSPFLPEIRQLEAIEHVLLVTYEKEDRLLSAPPEIQLPPRPLGVQLEAIRFHLALEETQVVRVVTPVLEEGLAPEEIVPALEAITTAVEGIQNRAAEGFTHPDSDPEVLEALSGLEAQAGSIVTTTSSLLPEAVCPCWKEEDIAYSTGDFGLSWAICVFDVRGPGGQYDWHLWEGDDELGANIWFTADSVYVDGVSGPPYRCMFGHNDLISGWDAFDVRKEITPEEYEACAVSIRQQAEAYWGSKCHPGS